MSSVSAVHATANSRINEHDHLSKPARRSQGATSSRVSSLYQTVKVVMISDCWTHCIKAWACSVDAAVWWWSSSSYHMSGWTSVTTALSLYWCVCVCPYDAFPTYVKCLFVTCVHCVYMRDSRLSAMLVCPSGTDPLVSGLCRALWSSWLLTRLSTARYRYWYCSCGDKVQL